MGTTTTTYTSQLNAATSAYQASCDAALSGSAASLRTIQSSEVLTDTLTILSTLCTEADKADEVTKTIEVNVASQVDCIADVLLNMEAIEAYTVSTSGSSAMATAEKELQVADQTLTTDLDNLATSISDAVVAGFGNTDTSVNGAAALFQSSVDRFNESVSDVLADAGTTFRTTTSMSDLNASLATLSKILQQADATPLTDDTATSYASEATALIRTVKSQLSALESSDITYIQSVKVATLDQPKLKSYATIMKGVDGALSGSLNYMFADITVDPGTAAEIEAAVKAAATTNVPNTPAPKSS